VDPRFLQECIAEGLSLEAMGERSGRHPSTVSYWLKKHGLQAAGSKTHAPKSAIDRAVLVALVEEDLSLREIAERLQRSVTTIRYWIRQHGIERQRCRQRNVPGGSRREFMSCRRHGLTEFVLEGRGAYRCSRCRAEAVGRRRRVIKNTLVREAGGSCAICGYSRSHRALQFHHLDPATKEFHLGQAGHCRSLTRSRIEASKCILLCANCHAEVEAGIAEIPLNSLAEADARQ
jgi:hypothetical protein